MMGTLCAASYRITSGAVMLGGMYMRSESDARHTCETARVTSALADNSLDANAWSGASSGRCLHDDGHLSSGE